MHIICCDILMTICCADGAMMPTTIMMAIARMIATILVAHMVKMIVQMTLKLKDNAVDENDDRGLFDS